MGRMVRDILMGSLGELRYEPVDKRIRGLIAGQVVIDTHRALLVWEPKRVVASYAVPAVHTTDGTVLDLRLDGTERPAAAFQPADVALKQYVIVAFDAVDEWFEEDERNLAHPRDPFHRIEIVHSSRSVRVERNGELLAASTRPYLLLEAPLPVRYYLPPEDVSEDLLHPSPTRTLCAYKGQAHYWSLEDADDIAWSYPDPLREAAEVTDRIAFFNEQVDLVVDGMRLERPVTPWSPR